MKKICGQNKYFILLFSISVALPLAFVVLNFLIGYLISNYDSNILTNMVIYVICSLSVVYFYMSNLRERIEISKEKYGRKGVVFNIFMAFYLVLVVIVVGYFILYPNKYDSLIILAKNLLR